MDTLREIRGLTQEAMRRGYKVTLLTGPGTPDAAFSHELDIRHVKGDHEEFIAQFTAICEAKEYDSTLALEALPGADYCIPIALNTYPEFPGREFSILDEDEAEKNKLEQALYRTPSDTIILNTGELQKLSLRLCYGVIPSRIHSLPPLLDDMAFSAPEPPEAVAAARKEFGSVEDDAILIVLPAVNWHDAGVDRALKALAIMPKEIQRRCRLLVIGGGGLEGQDALCTQAKRCGFLEGKLFYRNAMIQRRALLQAANLLLLPARNDFSGNALVDALACGLPILCSTSCGYSPFAQAAGCVVLSNPFDEEIFQEALAYTLPKLAVLREMLQNRAAKQPKVSRAAAILDSIEQFKNTPSPRLSQEEALEAVRLHLKQAQTKELLKDDEKRSISRCRTSAGTQLIVKEYKKNHFWEGNRHVKRSQEGTLLMRFFTPQCRAILKVPESSSRFMIFGDCGEGNFHSGDYYTRANAKNLFAACGATLAILHSAGIYHQDTKPANFVINDRCGDECPYLVCLVDCDNVKKMALPMDPEARIRNVAQFIAGTGRIVKADEWKWFSCIRAFQDGYARHALLSQTELAEFWNKVWNFIAEKKHIEYNLPFICDETHLKKIRRRLH